MVRRVALLSEHQLPRMVVIPTISVVAFAIDRVAKAQILRLVRVGDFDLDLR